ncbi:hypothetical protein GCM10027445_18980 [Amycolatopsis endophytica]
MIDLVRRHPGVEKGALSGIIGPCTDGGPGNLPNVVVPAPVITGLVIDAPRQILMTTSVI